MVWLETTERNELHVDVNIFTCSKVFLHLLQESVGFVTTGRPYHQYRVFNENFK